MTTDHAIDCDVKRLRLAAGDTLVVSTDVHITDTEAKKLQALFKGRFPQNAVIVHGPNIDLKVITERELCENELKALSVEAEKIRSDIAALRRTR